MESFYNRILTIIFSIFFGAITLFAQAQQRLDIKFSYSFNKQTYEYIEKLHSDTGIINFHQIANKIIIKNKEYKIISKDADTQNKKLRNQQFTVTDNASNEYIICFQENYILPVELKYQVILFQSNKPFEWIYYITNSGLQ